jgi:hypothetical protein
MGFMHCDGFGFAVFERDIKLKLPLRKHRITLVIISPPFRDVTCLNEFVCVCLPENDIILIRI